MELTKLGRELKRFADELCGQRKWQNVDFLGSGATAAVFEVADNLACTRFRRHRVRCFDGAGGGSWRDGSLPESSSLRLCA